MILQLVSSRAFGDVTVSENWQKCVATFSTAKSACTDPNSSAGMSSSDSSSLTSQLLIASQLATSVGAASGSAQVCTIAAGLSAAMQVVTLLKGDACSSTRNKCENACGEFSQNAQNRIAQLQITADSAAFNAAEIRDLTKKISTSQTQSKTCDGYQAQTKNAALQYLLLANSLVTAYKCATDLSSAVATATPVDLTTSVSDCSNASFAATSLVCICQTTPSDPMCGTSATLSGFTSAAVTSGSITTPSFASEEASDGTVVDTSAIGSRSQSGSATSGAGAGGGLGSSGGAGLIPGNQSDGTSNSGLDKNVITGTSGGGVAALAAGSSGSGANQAAANQAGAGSGASGGLDLKKYLPKALLKNRGLAGMNLPSVDGVTGPMGPSLWEKVSNRYQVVKPTLFQTKD
ncbi:MAG: hypothetical protein EOP05_09115 [Proteobacteria bacterium]|nr:MAG: hypothetical protein EOP05_09115 [Pseudomonadota bacterium]